MAMMNNREAIKSCLEKTKVVAIIRGMAPQICVKLAAAYRVGGIRLVEVPFNQVGSLDETVSAIKAIKAAEPKMFVGAGTVLTEAQLELAKAAGAEFIVMPNCNPALIRKASAAGLVTIPGTFTPSEMVAAHEAGADYIKVFPVRSLGPDYIRDVLVPLKMLKLIAASGVSVENAAAYIKAGCVAVGVSGALVNREWIAAGDYAKIADVAEKLVSALI